MKITKDELQKRLDIHRKWLDSNHEKGRQFCATFDDFEHADFRGADLHRAGLAYADFMCADLRCADFRGADLHGADFRGADLRGADLTGANLTCADLTDANFACAKLDDAELAHVNLRGVIFWDTHMPRIHATPAVYDAIAAVQAAEMALAKTDWAWKKAKAEKEGSGK